MDDKKTLGSLAFNDTPDHLLTIKPEVAPSDQPLVRKEPQYLPMVHGKATDTIALYGRAKDKDAITGKKTITVDGAKAVLDRALDETLAGGINVHKLLLVGISEFTRLNHIGERKKDDPINYVVAIPLK